MDIVERLRGPLQNTDEECFEAADEIERLRKALQFYADLEHYEYKRGNMSVMSNVEWNEIGLDQGDIARSALQQKDNE